MESGGDSHWLVALQRMVPGPGSTGKIFLHIISLVTDDKDPGSGS